MTAKKSEVKIDWRDKEQFYKTSIGICCVCHHDKDIGTEPRFGYDVCETHAKLSAIQINAQRKDRT